MIYGLSSGISKLAHMYKLKYILDLLLSNKKGSSSSSIRIRLRMQVYAQQHSLCIQLLLLTS